MLLHTVMHRLLLLTFWHGLMDILKGAAVMDQRWILHSSIGGGVAVVLWCGRTALSPVEIGAGAMKWRCPTMIAEPELDSWNN